MDSGAATTVCQRCGATTPEPATFCSQCGQPLDSTRRPANPRWYYNVWFVLFMLFFVVGPFGLPLVWKNPRLSRGVKLVLTVVMMAYTILLVDMTRRMFQAVMNEFNQLNSAL